ncbi:MAG: hypothetical protein CMP07_04990 [Xanthomonadales bacterium]|nr:hypothetical protein [Xanthomonadales bacterium]
MRRSTLLGICISMGIAATSVAWLGSGNEPAGSLGWNSAPASLRDVLWPEPREIGEFELVTQHGRPFTRDSFAGQWNFVFFGYLDCPDICPMSLGTMRQMRRLLIDRGHEKDFARFILVSVDSENDDPERMGSYLLQFDSEFVGLTGEKEMVDRLAESLAVHYRQVPDSDFNAIDHTSSLMIIDPQGRAVGALQPPLVPEQMADKFHRLAGAFPDY